MSSNVKATAQRAERAKKRKRDLDDADEQHEVALQRRRVSPATQAIYLTRVRMVQHMQQQLSDHSNAREVDAGLVAALAALYRAGEESYELRVTYYSLRWHYLLTDLELRRSKALWDGIRKSNRERVEDPEAYETVLLQTRALLEQGPAKYGESDTLAGCTGFLVQFDTFARTMELLSIDLAQGVSVPIPMQEGVAAKTVITFFPSSQAAKSKTKQQDDSVIVGATSARREWIGDLVRERKRCQRAESRLVPLTERRCLELFHASRRFARLQASRPHRLRHGGASADGANNVPEPTIRARGRWSRRESCVRYTKPARYLRQLALLSRVQLNDAMAAEAYLRKELPRRLRLARLAASK